MRCGVTGYRWDLLSAVAKPAGRRPMPALAARGVMSREDARK